MEANINWKKIMLSSLLVLVFNMVVSHEPFLENPGNLSSESEFSDIVDEQHKLPSCYNTSVDAELKHGAVNSLSHRRWQTQMAFSKTVYSFQVKEDTVPGTVVGKVEAQMDSPTPIAYSVQEDDGESMFLLSPVSGEFLLSRSLDFETQRFYILTLEVQQGRSQVSSVRVYFNVLDVNDNPPVFSQNNFSASLLEDTRVRTCFLSLDVSDKDDGENGEAELRVVSGDELGMFFIRSTSSLCLNKVLDREYQSSYNLTVTANDRAMPASSQLTGTAHVVVIVEDINDNAPFFVSAEHVSVPEDSALHSVILTVHAEDKDAGSNAKILYFLSDPSGGTFSIDNTTGEVFLKEILDREKADTLNITVTAADMGSPRLATTMNFTVHIDDVNDNDPVFSKSNYSLFIKEDIQRGTSLFQVEAQDQDIGSNGQVRYMLDMTPAGPFVVDTVRGVLSVLYRLDRERDSNYTLIFIATDQGDVPRSATAAINISVLDVNDFVPQFSPENLIIHVKENEEDPSQLSHQVTALDEDLGINSQLNYFIHKENSDELFSVTPNGLFQILHSLDREKEQFYTVIITAVDSGLPPLTGTLTIHITVDDVNDNHPEFSEEIYTTIVSEDSPIGTVFAMISASDADEGMSGEVRYFMENPDAPFAIEETSGELLTTDFLDRENVAFYILTVTGSDMHPTQPLSISVLVTVLIGDINDHWPQFLDSPFVAYVSTEFLPGSVVCAVRAIDGDTDINAELHYSLYGQHSDLFSIDPKTGTVFTSSLLQTTDDIIINVYVEDAGETPKFDVTTISIRFQNISEFPEMNVDVLSYSFYEDEPVGTLVAVISASSIRAETVSFYHNSGNFENMFHVDQLVGALTIENPLDYESKKEFSLLIEARDSGLPPFSSFLEIHINITDVNDNFPQFTQAEYRCEVYENSPPSEVCDVLAIDADSPNYSIVWYNITEGNNELFTIDPESGLVNTIVSLDRETIPFFYLTVEAAYPDNPLHADQATVIISVLDRNDNAPRFSQIHFAEVSENAPTGYTVLQITSTDDDTDLNAVIKYYIPDQNQDLPFDIDSISGCITVKRSLDRETQDYYVLKVNANDSAWSVSTDVSIFVLDFNDNRPVFSKDLYSIVIPETKHPEIFVLQVFATDIDIGQNGEIVYIVEPPNELFWVNASSGEVFTKQPLLLHNSAFEIYNFTVVAFDCGSIPLNSNTSVTVRLKKFNHHPPNFLPSPALVAIPYDLRVGTEVVKFSAVDLDKSSDHIRYSASGGNASDFFWIQADNGKVFLNRTLEESKNESLTLIVVAEDQGFPPLTSQTEINFEIIGKNQYSPRFSEPHVTFSVPEDLPIGSVAGKIQAQDRDYGHNGAITYCIGNEDKSFPVSVGELSGLLTLTRELDFEKETRYNLQIKATDGGWIAKSAWLNVTVIIMDVNDNPPVFPLSEYIATVPENSKVRTRVLDVKATDLDSGINAQISYFLIAGRMDKFAVDPKNGSITTLGVFDYEQEQMFDLTIKASNTARHTLFSLAFVTIHILDLNEFSPSFIKESFNFSVFKNVPVGTSIGKVTATDNDSGPEGQVFYLMFGHGKNVGFDIGLLSGEIHTSRSLRDQGNNNVILKVLAKNSGVIYGKNIAETLVNINVIDTNDAPMFTSIYYEAKFKEDTPTGTSVLTVSALDQDSVLNWNRLIFRIVDGNTNSSFSIYPISGIVLVNSPLDRELWPVYNLTVTATDNGSPPATGTTNVIVSIIDINDNAPKLMTTKVQVKENQPEGTIVSRLNAFDLDLPPNQGPFIFWLSNLSAESAFFLTPDGVLLTTRNIDREHVSEYRLQVVIKDAGFPLSLSSTTMLHIRVEDENDNLPLPRNIFIEVKYFGSSFNGGMIGNVHPEDHDVSDTFICAIKSGPINMFTIPNGTCELWSSPFQGEATFNVTVEATDQVHFPVNNSIYINYKGFTNASLDSCIFFYVSSHSMENFLTNSYLRFVKALDSLFNLQASKTHVFGIKHVEMEILLLAAVKNYNGQYLSREIASSISAGHKKLLESQSNVTISQITSDPCLMSPCQNGATCSKNIYISQKVAVLESMAVIFVSPQKEIFNCTCSVGFSGSFCEDDIDECEANPCENNSTCENTEGSFHCHCQSGFSGSVCSADVDECLRARCQNGGTCIQSQEGYHCQCVPGFEGERCEQLKDHCRSTPCFQGHCINLNTGFLCSCPFGVSGVHCEELSYGFEETSFVEFPPLDRRTNLIYFEFATVQRDSLLLYNPGTLSSREFFALEILDGTIQLSYDLGSGIVKLQTLKQVSDGRFHSVTVKRIGNMGSLLVDNCTDVVNNGFCYSKSDGIFSERTLDIGNTNMTFGGVRSLELILQHPSQIKTHDFVGCIRNIQINSILLRPSLGLTTYNVFSRCPRAAESGCNSSPCKNGGVCHDLWSNYVCECESPFTGRNCETEMSEDLVLTFKGSDYIEYVIKERFKRDLVLKALKNGAKQENTTRQTLITIKFKTIEDGTLLYILGERGNIMLMVRDKKPVYNSMDTTLGYVSEFTVELFVADGLWHILTLLGSEHKTSLTVDDKIVLNITEQNMDFRMFSLEKIILGGAPQRQKTLQYSGFNGCVEYLNVSGHTLPISGHSLMVEVWPSSTLLQSSCNSQGICLFSPCAEETPFMRACLSDCQNRRMCRPSTQEKSCICLQNVSDNLCDICISTFSEECSEKQNKRPFWVIALVLPLITILIAVCVFAVLYRLKQQDSKSKKETLPHKKGQETENTTFCFVCKQVPKAALSASKRKPYENEKQLMLPSELEYCEIGSICSTSNSDKNSPNPSWHKHVYSRKCHSNDSNQWGDLRMLLGKLKKDNCSEQKDSPKPQNIANLHKPSFCKHDTEQQRQKVPCYSKKLPQAEFLEPTQPLSCEEITKLNAPLEPGFSHQALLQAGPIESIMTTDNSSEFETDSTFTCSESEYDHFFITPGKKFRNMQCFPSESIVRLDGTLPGNSFFELTSSSTLSQDISMSVPFAMFEQWEKEINEPLTFETYAAVCEDIAGIPLELSQNRDMQSDEEEII